MANRFEELTHLKRPWCWEILKARGEGDDRRWEGWRAAPTRCTWVWVNFGSWWWKVRPSVLWFMGSQRVGHDWVTKVIALQNFAVVCQTSESAIDIHISPAFWTSLPSPSSSYPSRLMQSPCLSFLAIQQIPVGYLFYIWQCKFPCCSLHTSHSLSLSPCPQVCSLCLFLHCCPGNKFFSTILLDSIYMH